jgi:hypothetical protein
MTPSENCHISFRKRADADALVIAMSSSEAAGSYPDWQVNGVKE